MSEYGGESAPSSVNVPLMTPSKQSSMPRLRAYTEDGLANVDVLVKAWPLRLLQVLGVWQPTWVPRALAWIYYVLLLAVEGWFVFWLVYYGGRKYNLAVGVLHGLDQLAFFLLWTILPWSVARKAGTLVNTIDYVVRKNAAPMTLFNVAYLVLFILITAPQIVYVALVGIPFLHSEVAPVLPWNAASKSAATADVALLGAGMVLNVLYINTALLYVGISAHLQTFQINDFLHKHVLHRQSSLNMNAVKSVLHLSVQSLQKGNRAVEPINTVLVVGIMLELIEVLTAIVINDRWNVGDLVPFGLLLLQIFFFLLPPAYVTRCWDRAFNKLLSLHALALHKEDELGAIILYMKEAYRGYTITNVRIDSSGIVYFCYAIIALLAIKVQRDVHFWMPN